jgi:hypothetical protein
MASLRDGIIVMSKRKGGMVMAGHSVVWPRLAELTILLLLPLTLIYGCGGSTETTGNGAETTDESAETTDGGMETTDGGAETTSGDQTADDQTHARAKEETGSRVTRRGSDLLRPSFVGEVYGTSAFIGIAFPGNTIPAEGPDEGMEVIVFITDGDPEKMGIRGAYGEWFRGSVNEEGALDSLESNLGVEIWGPVTEKTSTGAIRFEEDAVFPFRADLVSKDTTAGLYRQEGEVEGIGYTAGWIELPDGRMRGSSYPPYIPCCGPEDCPSQTKECTSQTKECTSQTKECTSQTKECTSQTKECTSQTKECTSQTKECLSQTGGMELTDHK